MSNIIGVIARVYVDDIDAALPLYQRLTGITDVNRFTFRDVELASVGPFLLLSGNTAGYQNRVATIEVAALAPVLESLAETGGEVLEGPAQVSNGSRLIARHPDGSVFEYIGAQ
jgi:predicted enzyme related to lactoylglutathione lyase